MVISEGLLALIDLPGAFGVAQQVCGLEGPSVLEATINQPHFGRALRVYDCGEVPKLVVGRRCAQLRKT